MKEAHGFCIECGYYNCENMAAMFICTKLSQKIRKEGTRRWEEDIQGRKKGSVGGGQTGSGQ